ncbi:MAG: TetR family transcriptional regulator [Methylocella sp.]
MAAISSLRTTQRVAVMRSAQFAALELFSRDGFAAVSIERIAEKAQTSPATV